MKDYMKIQKSSVKSGGGTCPAQHTHTHTYTHTHTRKYISFTQKHQLEKNLKNIEVHLVYVIDFEGEFSNEILTHFLRRDQVSLNKNKTTQSSFPISEYMSLEKFLVLYIWHHLICWKNLDQLFG